MQGKMGRTHSNRHTAFRNMAARSIAHWEGVVPQTIAERQVIWEYQQRVLLAYESGASADKIAAHAQADRSRIHYYIDRAKRDRESGRLSPVERYFRLPIVMWLTKEEHATAAAK